MHVELDPNPVPDVLVRLTPNQAGVIAEWMSKQSAKNRGWPPMEVTTFIMSLNAVANGRKT
jgi:hypothetical protein